MLEKIKAYWGSKQSNIHGLILFLGGSAGFVTLQKLGLHDFQANFICGAAVLLAAILYTPDSK